MEEKENESGSYFPLDISPKEAAETTQPVEVKAKVKPKTKAVKSKRVIALKTCIVRFGKDYVELYKDQPISGLTSQELKVLKDHRFIKEE